MAPTGKSIVIEQKTDYHLLIFGILVWSIHINVIPDLYFAYSRSGGILIADIYRADFILNEK